MTDPAPQTGALALPEALLFDLDGVIADVSRSYRQAIIEAATSFGVQVDAIQVATEKAAGNANNDWVLTQRLLQANGKDVPLDVVTARFESVYQGTPEAPGLWRTETLLVDPELLGRLAKTLPLGIVTGRPRHDAERFIAHTEIGRFFRAMVCMEDGPAKPDPTPVRLLLGRLGVSRAWLVGDTPDDMRAAQSAGVIPFGIVAHGDSVNQAGVNQMIAALHQAGAAHVLDTVAQLEQLLGD